MPNQPPASRLQILEKGGRLVVIDRETGLPPLSAADRMREYDAQSGAGPTKFASMDSVQASKSAGAEKSSATAGSLHHLAAAQQRASKASKISHHDLLAQGRTAGPDAKPMPLPSSFPKKQQDWVVLLLMIGGALILLTSFLGLKSFFFVLFAIGFSLFQGWPQQMARKLVQLSDQQKHR